LFFHPHKININKSIGEIFNFNLTFKNGEENEPYFSTSDGNRYSLKVNLIRAKNLQKRK